MGGNKYEIHFKKLRSNFEGDGDRSTRENDIAEDAQAYMDSIQNMLKKYPFNWFNFYDYWDEE
jgi:predicted LPLAT superfamily acyltransferase